MKLLLTSAGIKNQSIHNALLELLGKPTAECSALAITTASYGHPMSGPIKAWEFVNGIGSTPMVELGWKSVGLLELTALPSISRDLWVPLVQETDVLLVNGGDTMFLCHWMRESGLAELLPSLDIVWVGLSAGSVVMSPKIGREFVNWPEPRSDDEALGFIDFAMFPHLGHPDLPEQTLANAERWADNLKGPTYAIDDETAFKVVDGEVEIISEGTWHLIHG